MLTLQMDTMALWFSSASEIALILDLGKRLVTSRTKLRI